VPAVEHGWLFEWLGRAPLVAPLGNKDLAAQHLLENLFKGAHISKRRQRSGVQEEGTFISADDRRDDERTFVTSELECPGDGCSLASVEHANRCSPWPGRDAKRSDAPMFVKSSDV
jgi:hypothetical protein